MICPLCHHEIHPSQQSDGTWQRVFTIRGGERTHIKCPDDDTYEPVAGVGVSQVGGD